MRCLLLVVFMATVNFSFGQSLPSSFTAANIGNTYSNRDIEVVSRYDTTILNVGNPNCRHEWVVKKHIFNPSACAVNHGPSGCPNDWTNEYRICRICLRHENIKETRTEVSKPNDYEALIEKIQK